MDQGHEGYASQLAKQANGAGLLIGVDGPSGSGKSTVSKQVADILGLGFLETGAMYRALTWLCLQRGVDISNPDAVLDQAGGLSFTSAGTISEPKFYVGDKDVTEDLRSNEVASAVSLVASYPAVRDWMVKAQREQMLQAKSSGKGMVAEGRDITTVVCPDADVRVLLVADPQARLRRRVLETYGEVTEEGMAEMEELVYGRDTEDSKVTAFLEAAHGVETVDSSDLTVNQVVNRVLGLVESALRGT